MEKEHFPVQTILTDIRVVGHELRLSFAGLGTITAADYLHSFPLTRVPEQEAVLAQQELTWKERLKDCSWRTVSTFFPALVVDAPIEIAQAKCYTLRQLKHHLLNDPWTESEERLRLFAERMMDYLIQNPPPGRKPYSLRAIKEHLVAHPRVQSRHHHTIDALLRVLEEGWPIHFPEELEKDKTPKVRIPSPLPEAFYRGGYSKQARWKIATKGSIVSLDDTLVEEIQEKEGQKGKRTVSINGCVQYIRPRTVEELLAQPRVIVDIETPLYGTAEEEVSWTAVIASHNGQQQKTVFSLYPMPLRVDDFVGQSCRGEQDLVARVKEEIRRIETVDQPHSTIFIAYNVPFDAIQLRDAGEFTIGDEEEEPKKVSTIPFFERIGIQGMDVLDLLRWARIQYDYLPDRKLVTVARHVLGDDAFYKQITYGQQRELERICRGQDPATCSAEVQKMVASRPAVEIIASYVKGDVLVLDALVQSGSFHHALEDVTTMARIFRVDPFLLLHDPKRIQDYLERRFFERVGIFREALFPHYKTFTQYERRVKNKLSEVVEKSFPAEQEGVYQQVVKVYLPLGKPLRQDVKWFYGEAKEFYCYVDEHRDDPQRHFFLARYEDTLAEWMWKDYAAHLYEQDKFRKMIPQHERRSAARDVCWDIAQRLCAAGLEEKVHRSSVAQRDLRAAITPEDWKKLNELSADFQTFHRWFTQWCRVKEKNRVLFGAYEADWQTYQMRLADFCSEVNEFFTAHGITVIHAQNRYLYLAGNTSALYRPESPVIPVDTINNLYRAGGRVYYQRYGSWKGIKREAEPTHHLSVFESNVFGSFLEQLLDGKQEEAFSSLKEQLRAFACHDIPPTSLLRRTESTGLYNGYECGKEIVFYDWDDSEDARTKVLGGKEWRMERQHGERGDFIEEPFKEGKEVAYQKRLLRSHAYHEPDLEMYEQRITYRLEALLRPLLGKRTEHFIRDALTLSPL